MTSDTSGSGSDGLTLLARAVYRDSADATDYEYRIETRDDVGYALIHGVAGRDDLETEATFGHTHELLAMLPDHPDEPAYAAARDVLLRAWYRATWIPTPTALRLTRAGYVVGADFRADGLVSVERRGRRLWLDVRAGVRGVVTGGESDPGDELFADVVGVLEGPDARERLLAQRPPDNSLQQADDLHDRRRRRDVERLRGERPK